MLIDLLRKKKESALPCPVLEGAKKEEEDVGGGRERR